MTVEEKDREIEQIRSMARLVYALGGGAIRIEIVKKDVSDGNVKKK